MEVLLKIDRKDGAEAKSIEADSPLLVGFRTI